MVMIMMKEREGKEKEEEVVMIMMKEREGKEKEVVRW